MQAGSIRVIPAPIDGNPWKALLIGDLHIIMTDGTGDRTLSDLDLTINRILPEIIRREQPRQIIILGDIFHNVGYQLYHNRDTFFDWANDYVKRLTNICFESAPSVQQLIMMGGNHDRVLFYDLADGWNELRPGHITACKEFFLELTPAKLPIGKTATRCILCHNGGHDHQIGTDRIFDTFHALHKLYGFGEGALLVTAHVHVYQNWSDHDIEEIDPEIRAERPRIGCIGTLSLNKKNRKVHHYGVLTESSELGKFVFTGGSITADDLLKVPEK